MTGPEHYREAELLLASLDETIQSTEQIQLAITQAQVHATLAVADAALSEVVYEIKDDQPARPNTLGADYLDALARSNQGGAA